MADRINLKETPVIDAHCFAYSESPLTWEFLVRYFSLGGVVVGSMQTSPQQLAGYYAENTVAFRAFTLELSRFLSCSPSTEELLRARDDRAADFRSYTQALMSDAGLKTLVVDNGAKALSEVDEFAGLFPGTVEKTFRLETLVRDLLEESKSFDSLVSAFDGAIQRAVAVQGCVALKSVIAYRTGLDVGKVNEEEARTDFDARAERVEWFGPYVKQLRDYLLRRALLASVDLQVPVLIHTGLGDTDIVASKCNPAFLADLLKDDEIMPAKVLLIHGGFPYTFEAGWLANVLPNVYLELSSSLPPFLEPAVSPRRYGDLLRWVPLPKLVYGSDGSDFPEMPWYYAKTAKGAMARALSELVEAGLFTERRGARSGYEHLLQQREDPLRPLGGRQRIVGESFDELRTSGRGRRGGPSTGLSDEPVRKGGLRSVPPRF